LVLLRLALRDLFPRPGVKFSLGCQNLLHNGLKVAHASSLELLPAPLLYRWSNFVVRYLL
jgi:hypothetical protein